MNIFQKSNIISMILITIILILLYVVKRRREHFILKFIRKVPGLGDLVEATESVGKKVIDVAKQVPGLSDVVEATESVTKVAGKTFSRATKAIPGVREVVSATGRVTNVAGKTITRSLGKKVPDRTMRKPSFIRNKKLFPQRTNKKGNIKRFVEGLRKIYNTTTFTPATAAKP